MPALRPVWEDVNFQETKENELQGSAEHSQVADTWSHERKECVDGEFLKHAPTAPGPIHTASYQPVQRDSSDTKHTQPDSRGPTSEVENRELESLRQRRQTAGAKVYDSDLTEAEPLARECAGGVEIPPPSYGRGYDPGREWVPWQVYAAYSTNDDKKIEEARKAVAREALEKMPSHQARNLSKTAMHPRQLAAQGKRCYWEPKTKKYVVYDPKTQAPPEVTTGVTPTGSEIVLEFLEGRWVGRRQPRTATPEGQEPAAALTHTQPLEEEVDWELDPGSAPVVFNALFEDRWKQPTHDA